MKSIYEPLFEPLKIGDVEVKNKFFMAPMATIVDVDEDYCYTQQSIDYYVERAKGGVGLIITGANWVENDVEPHARCSFPCPNMLPLKYEHKAKEMTDRTHAFGTKIFLQLTAGLGRSALPNFVDMKDFVAPSPTTNRWIPNAPCRELTTEEIEHIIEKFGDAAVIAKNSGFDGVEIHAVHEGYLLDCFTMTLFNQRTDKYGGDLKGRLRFATEIVETIKNKCGKDFPVILRFSIKSYIKQLRQGGLPGEDFKELGRDIDEAIEAVKILQEAGYDAFDADARFVTAEVGKHFPAGTNVAVIVEDDIYYLDALSGAVDLTNYYTKTETDQQITTKISSLDKSDSAVENQFVTAVSQIDGVISVTRAAITEAAIPAFNINNATQAEGDYLIINCGTSSDVI